MRLSILFENNELEYLISDLAASAMIESRFKITDKREGYIFGVKRFSTNVWQRLAVTIRPGMDTRQVDIILSYYNASMKNKPTSLDRKSLKISHGNIDDIITAIFDMTNPE